MPFFDPSAPSAPSLPEERDAQNLPPKSYAEAVETERPKTFAEAVELPPPDSHKEPDGPIGTPVQSKGLQLRPIDIGKAQYTGKGLDDSPRSPTRGHKRMSSRKSNGGKPPKPNNEKKDDSEDSVVLENYQDSNGSRLATVNPSDQYNTDDRGRIRAQHHQKSELVSGRRAGAGWHTSSIRFAPLNVPLQRRLQTLMVLAHTLSIVGFLTAFFWLCSVPLLWPILLPYLLYVLFSSAATSGTLSHRNERFRRSKVWSLYAGYFPARLHRSEELPPTRKYIFGYHPHGIISHGAFAAFATEALGFSQLFPGITNSLLTLDSNFRIPLYRDYALRMGLASVSRESIENILSKGGQNGEGMGRAVTIVVGGARESLDARPNSMKLVLACRKGFVKLAIRNGADLVPVLSFGENDLYEQVDAAKHPMIHKFQLLVKKIAGFTVPLFHARGVFNYDVGMMPYRRPMNIVVGRPIKVVTQEHPQQEYIEQVHGQYVQELERIWNDWKDTFAKDRDSELQVVE